jgi:hypothetical protein
MSVDPNILANYAGKNVNIKLTGEYAELSGEGKVEAASTMGVAFKPKGKGTVIVLPSDVDAIEAAAVVKKITRKSMLPVTLDNVRQHLVDRHGYKVSDIEQYTPEQALEFHSTLEHAELGHDHTAKPKDERPIAEPAAA